MDKKKKTYEIDFPPLPTLRFALGESGSLASKQSQKTLPVQKHGSEMELYVRKLIAHLTETK